MARVFGDEAHQGGPKTHVLIIGVGRYKHLGPARPDLPALGQLTSPPVSARALADWFTAGKLNSNRAPLGSVELVLSDPAGQAYGPGALAVEDATFDNIRDAFDAWDLRCDGHADNVAIFYFCGHGLQKDSWLLLPEDFGESRNNRWAKAIDFNRTFRGLSQCKAGIQFYIVDACRQLSQKMVTDLDAEGTTLKTFVFGKQQLRLAPGLFATANGLAAFGDTGKTSRMTAALIDCLDGLGASYGPGGWVIEAHALGRKVRDLIERRNADLPASQRQSIDPAILESTRDSQRLHRIAAAQPPPVIIDMSCEPADQTDAARFYLVPQGGAREDANAKGRWIVSKPGGMYQFGCTLAPQAPQAVTMQVDPPVLPVTFEL